MRLLIIKVIILCFVLLCLPLAGLITFLVINCPDSWPEGSECNLSLVRHAPYSSVIVVPITIAALGLISLAFWSAKKSDLPCRSNTAEALSWWTYFGIAGLLIGWLLAWTRFDWFSSLQIHTFFPLWLSYIVVINGLTKRKSGKCLLTTNPWKFILLFSLSTILWWYYEYLNLLIFQCWHYHGLNVGIFGYFLFGTIAFSTILPAISSTAQYLQTFHYSFSNLWLVDLSKHRFKAGLLLLISIATLFGGRFLPSLLFPSIFLSPLIIYVSLNILLGQERNFSELGQGDWSKITVWSLAGLICGFFWEMWNYHSLGKWKYSFGYFDGLKLFELPLIGYIGYIPLGLTCAVVYGWVYDKWPKVGP